MQVIEYGGAKAIIDVFNAIDKNTNLLPKKEQDDFENLKPEAQKRRICDYIAGMTDNYLLNLYSKLTGVSAGSVFERL